MKYIKRLDLQQKHLLLLLISWMIVQAALLNHYGIITSNEAIKYAREAHNILAHKSFSEQKYIFYSVYIFIHIVFIKLGFETTGVYIFQLLLNLTATYLFYNTVLKVYQQKRIAFVAALLLIVCIPFQYWTICLYTESLFCSLTVIVLYCLFGLNKSNGMKYTYAALLFLLLLFSRPTGIFFIAVIATMIFYKFLKTVNIVAAISSLLLLAAGFILVLYYEVNSASRYNFIKPFLEHYVICDVPHPGSTVQTNIYGSGTKAVILYARDHTVEFLHLCFLRFISFWSLARPCYSGLHNWMLRIFFYPLYLFTVISMIKQWKTKPALVIFCLVTMGIFTASVILPAMNGATVLLCLLFPQ